MKIRRALCSPPFVYGCMETKTIQELKQEYKDLSAKLSDLDGQALTIRRRLSTVKLELIQNKLSTLVKDKDLYYLRGGKYIKVEYIRPNNVSCWYTATFRNPKSDKEYPIWLNDIFYLDGEEYKPLLPGRRIDHLYDPFK